jgi:hypothetical protein
MTVQTATLHPVIADLWAQTERIKAEANSLVTGLTSAQFNWRPGPGRWSIGECLGHLNAMSDMALIIERLIGQAQAQKLFSQGPYRKPWPAQLFIKLTEPPYRMKVKTFPFMVPQSSEPVEQVLPKFLALQDQLQGWMQEANGLDLGGLTAPNWAKLNFTLGQWLLFILAHERRHLWQAQNVRNHPQFPQQ